jgi:hypothetical protein
MDEYRFRRRDQPQERQPHPNSGEGIQFLLRAEKQLLQSISARAPLPEILNGICSALDWQIGNVVSLISLPEDDASDLAAIAMNAAHFGLYIFWSEGVVAENDELVGSLEMYCSVPRSPSASEFQLIERAKCLAAIAIKLDNQSDYRGNCGMQRNRPVRGRVLEWPVSIN